MDYQLYIDFGFLAFMILLLLSIFPIPSKKKVLEKGIVFLPKNAMTLQYLVGGLAVISGAGLFALFYYNREITNIINALFLMPLGILVLYNTYSTNKLVGKMQEMEEKKEEEEAAEVEPVKAEVVEEKKAKPKVVTIQCPGCQKYLNVEMSKSPLVISCPNCGLEGEVS